MPNLMLWWLLLEKFVTFMKLIFWENMRYQHDDSGIYFGFDGN